MLQLSNRGICSKLVWKIMQNTQRSTEDWGKNPSTNFLSCLLVCVCTAKGSGVEWGWGTVMAKVQQAMLQYKAEL